MSPLTQGRGLKFVIPPPVEFGIKSPLTQGRGLKLQKVCFGRCNCIVAPHAGAWIEIFVFPFCISNFYVAPHAGAWIEIQGIHVKKNST